MLLKFIGGILIIISCTAGGMSVSGRISRRTKAVEQYLSLLIQAENMISYCRFDIREILSSLCDIPLLEGMVQNCLDSMDRGNDFESSWTDAVVMLQKDGILKAEDKELIGAFGSGFGLSGAYEEISRIRLCRSRTEQVLERMIPETASMKKICRLVGSFCGVMIAAILV